MFYKTNEAGKIVCFADYQFDEGVMQTDRPIVQGYDGFFYFEGEQPIAPPCTAQEEVLRLEQAYGLPRPVRTALLSCASELPPQLEQRLAEIEAAAAPLRRQDGGASEPEPAATEPTL